MQTQQVPEGSSWFGKDVDASVMLEETQLEDSIEWHRLRRSSCCLATNERNQTEGGRSELVLDLSAAALRDPRPEFVEDDEALFGIA